MLIVSDVPVGDASMRGMCTYGATQLQDTDYVPYFMRVCVGARANPRAKACYSVSQVHLPQLFIV